MSESSKTRVRTKAPPHESNYARKLRLEREGKREPFTFVEGHIPRVSSQTTVVQTTPTETITGVVVHFDRNRGGALLRGDGERKFFLSFRDLALPIPDDFGIGSAVRCEVGPRMGSKHMVVMRVLSIAHEEKA